MCVLYYFSLHVGEVIVGPQPTTLPRSEEFNIGIYVYIYFGLDSFVRGDAFWEGEHVRLVLTPNYSKGLTKDRAWFTI